MIYPAIEDNSQTGEAIVCPSRPKSSLEWLLNPISKEEFFADYWEKKPLVLKRQQPDYFSSLLSLDEVDRVITTLDRRYPDVTLKNARARVSADQYTVNGDSLDVARVYQLFAQGSTISLAFLDTVVPSLAGLCRTLEREFSCPFQTNVYLTPPGAQGAKPHYDSHDVFVLQVVNSKQWTIYGTPVELPLAGQGFDAALHEIGSPTLEFTLEAGDLAYIPRGVAHDAHSDNNLSLHITAGALCYKWADLLLELVAEKSLGHPAFRKALPPGFAGQNFDRTQARNTLKSLLQHLSTSSELDPILDRFIDEFVSACPPLLRGQMAQLETLDSLTIRSVVGARPGAVFHLRTNGASASVACYGRAVTFPSRTAEALEFALSSSQFVVSELPCDLDDEGKLTLVQRLVREGLVQVLAP